MALLKRFASIVSIRTDDANVRRRGRNVIIVALSLLGFGLLVVPFGPTLNEWTAVLGLLGLFVAVQTGAILLARRGYVTPGALLMISMAIIGPVLTQAAVQASLTLSFQLVIPLLFASITLRPRAIGLVLVAALGGLGVMTLISSNSPELLREISLLSGGLLVMVALIGLIGAISTERALADAAAARAESEAARQLLATANAQLETHVAERTSALTHSLAAQKQQAETLQEALARKQELDSLIADLSLPIIPVRHDTLVVPLIGSLDGDRTTLLLERTLHAVETQRAHLLILDVTGVPIIDTAVAGVLIKLSYAVQLLGATTMLVGVRPEVAQTLVGLGVDLGNLRTEATLQEGLATVRAG